jgi:predicted metalloprotease with PDZ domain
MLRTRSDGSLELDDVMRHLWRHFGAHFETAGAGVPEDGLYRAAVAVAPGMKGALERFFTSAVNGTADLPLKALLSEVGLELAIDKGGKPALGARTAAAADGVKLTHVLDGGGAQAAGLSAGDVVIAVDGIKVNNAALDTLLARRTRGATVRVHAFRRDELIEREVRLGRAELTVELKSRADAGSAAARVRRAWLQA